MSVNQLRQSQREAELELQALQLQEREIQINKNKTASSSEIGDRLYEAGLSVKQSKSRFIRKSLRAREEELKKITFTPQITAFAEQLPENNSKKIVLERLNTPIKPSQKFLEVRKEVQHERVKECTFVPKISINSQKIAAFQARQHTRRWKCEPHLRLYKQAVQRHEQKRRRESEKKFEDDMHVNQFKLELMRLKELEKKKAVKKKKRRERQKRLRRYASQYSVGDYIHAGLDADELAYDYGYGYQRYSRDDETPFGLPMGKGDAGDGGNIKNHENDKGKNKGQDQDDSGNNNNGNNNNNGASNNDRVNHHPTHITHASENGGGDENKYDDRSVAHSRSSFLSQPATVYQQSKLKTNLANTSTVSNSTSPAHEHTTPSLAASIQSSSSSTKQRDLLATHTSKDTTASAPSPPPTHHHTPPQYPDIVQKQLRQYQQQHQRQHTLASPSTTPSTGSVSSSTTPAYPRSHSHSSDHTPSSDTNVTRANSVNGSSVSDAPVTGSAEDLQRQVAMYQEQLIALQQQLEDKEKKEGRPGEKSRKKTRGGGGKGARKGNCSVSSEKGAGDGGRRAVKKKRRRRKKKKKHSFLDRVKSDISRKKTRMKRTVRKHTKGHYHVDPSTGAEVFHPFFTPQISAGSTALLDSKKYNTKAVYSDQPRGGETPAMEKKKRQLKRESKQRAGNYPYAQHSREIIDNLKTQRFREIFMLLGGAKGYLSQTCLLELNRLSANQLQFVRPLLQTHHRGQIEKARAAVTHHMQKRRRQKDRDRAAQRGSEGTSNRYDNGDLFGKGSGSGSENSEDSDASDVFDEEGVDWFVSLEEFCNMLDAELVRQRSAHGATHLMLLKQRQSKRAAAKVKAKEAEKRKKEKQRELQEMQEQLQRAQQYTQPVEERTAGYARASYRHESGDIENSEESGQESRTEEEEDEDAEYNSDEDVENQTETYSFHPTLNYQSRVLADNHRLKERERNVPLHDILYHESHLLRQKKETRHTQKMQQELSKLSFQPNLHRKSRSRV